MRRGEFEHWINVVRSHGIEVKMPQGEKVDPKRPICKVCGGFASTQQQSVLHPDVRLLCWPCAEREVVSCGESFARKGGKER